MINEILLYGRENAITGRRLADLLGVEPRAISQAVERERRKGFPICAATGENPGYYLAADEEELSHYIKSLRGRASEILQTEQALMNTLTTINNQGEKVTI